MCRCQISGVVSFAASTSAATVHSSANASSAVKSPRSAEWRLPLVDELADQLAQLRAHRLGGRGVPAALAVDAARRERAGELAHEDREALALGRLVPHRACERESAFEERRRDRLDQRLARREVAVDRADPDAGAARDVLHSERRAVARVLVRRGLEHPLAVACRVDALAAHRTCSPIARPASAGAIAPSTVRPSNSWPSVGLARLARDGTNAAATPAKASATPSTMNETS